MLANLHVKNLALIDECEIDFTNGLNILTGETGAGKSIIIGSISLALGAKASKDLIRENADYALVEIVFQIDNEAQIEKLKEMDIAECDDGQIIISRKITNGKSISKINGETVPIGKIKEVSEILIDIHGQHEHQSLLYKKKHLEIIDAYAKEKLKIPKNELEETFFEYERIKNELEESLIDEEQKQREISFAEFAINEIEEANLKIGEDDELEELHKRMVNSKKIISTLNEIYQITGYDDGSAGDGIGRASGKISHLVEYDKKMEEFATQLMDIDSLLSDLNREISDYMDSMDFSDEEYEETEKRLDLINNLKAKYGKTIEDILNYQKEQSIKLDKLISYEEYVAKLNKDLEMITKKLDDKSKVVSKIRKEAADELSVKIKEALVDLNFINVQFGMEINTINHFTKNGVDDMEFIISTNPGEDMKPLGKVASGGELSRIMLAIKTVLSDKDETDTLIFDEIDVGISGRTAQMVSEKMSVIGKKHQVLCITHLPQIAAMADSHFVIEKKSDNVRTTTNIRRLNDDEIIDELARILGGAQITQTVIDSAKEMKYLANSTKKA